MVHGGTLHLHYLSPRQVRSHSSKKESHSTPWLQTQRGLNLGNPLASMSKVSSTALSSLQSFKFHNYFLAFSWINILKWLDSFGHNLKLIFMHHFSIPLNCRAVPEIQHLSQVSWCVCFSGEKFIQYAHITLIIFSPFFISLLKITFPSPSVALIQTWGVNTPCKMPTK